MNAARESHRVSHRFVLKSRGVGVHEHEVGEIWNQHVSGIQSVADSLALGGSGLVAGKCESPTVTAGVTKGDSAGSASGAHTRLTTAHIPALPKGARQHRPVKFTMPVPGQELGFNHAKQTPLSTCSDRRCWCRTSWASGTALALKKPAACGTRGGKTCLHGGAEWGQGGEEGVGMA